jgi:hypothetical protein
MQACSTRDSFTVAVPTKTRGNLVNDLDNMKGFIGMSRDCFPFLKLYAPLTLRLGGVTSILSPVHSGFEYFLKDEY